MSDVDVFDDRRCELGEGPSFDERTGRVWWVDIMGSRLLWRDLAGDTGEVDVGEHVGAAVPRVGGGMVACLRGGPVAVAEDGTITPLARYPVNPDEPPARRSNDAKADPAGRLWLGTMAYAAPPGTASLYRLDPGATDLLEIVPDVTISNGLGWSPDRTSMYYVDTPTHRIDVFDYDVNTGAIERRRPFVTIEDGAGSPDGLCVDADGAIWLALWGGSAVRRYTPDGKLERVVAVPTPKVTSCAFAGEGFDRLVITTAGEGLPDDPDAGLTYVYQPGDVVGSPVDRFAG